MAFRQYKIHDKKLSGWIAVKQYPDGKWLLKIDKEENAKLSAEYMIGSEIIKYERINYPELITEEIPRKQKNK